MRINPSRTIEELLIVLAYITDVEKKNRFFHAWKVAIFSAHFAAGKADNKQLKDIFFAALMHDVGGVSLPQHILHYLKKPDGNNRDLLMAHPVISAQFTSIIPQMSEAAKIVLDHHERVDGNGYPSGKNGKNIPWQAQIIRIADCIDVMLQKDDRASLSKISRELKECYAEKEVPLKMITAAIKQLSSKGLLKELGTPERTIALFNSTRRMIPPLSIRKHIDAIGTTLEVISQIIDMKHQYSSGHSLRVARYAMSSAFAMKLSHDEVTAIKWAGLIHDIGKLSISRRILDKPSGLTPREYQEIKKHVVQTRNIMDMLPSLVAIKPMAACHHEYYDGSGYPLGLKGEEIPLGARILTICDAFDAMISNRPYRAPLTPQKACEEIEKNAGTQFDPRIVKNTISIFRNLGL